MRDMRRVQFAYIKLAFDTICKGVFLKRFLPDKKALCHTTIFREAIKMFNTKYLCIKKGYIRIGKPAYTNIIYRNKSVSFNFSPAWLVRLMGCNTKVIHFN